MKVHVAIGNDRALCGVVSRAGKTHDIRTTLTVGQTRDDDLCVRCRELLELRGYSVEKLRAASMRQVRANIVADRSVVARHA